MEDLAKGFLDSYAWLSAWALEKGKCTFHKVIKFHTFQHLILDARFLNPRGHWTCKDEDFVGRVSALAHSVGVRSTRLSVKVWLKYSILLQLLLTRPGVLQVMKQFE